MKQGQYTRQQVKHRDEAVEWVNVGVVSGRDSACSLVDIRRADMVLSLQRNIMNIIGH